MTRDDVRDYVIDWLHAHCPNLLTDDVIPEGLIYLANEVWAASVRDERRRRMEAIVCPRTFELN